MSDNAGNRFWSQRSSREEPLNEAKIEEVLRQADDYHPRNLLPVPAATARDMIEAFESTGMLAPVLWWTGWVKCRVCSKSHVSVIPVPKEAPEPPDDQECPFCGCMACDPVEAGDR